MSPYFNFWKMCYTNKWVKLDMVTQACSKGIITAIEFKTITDIDFVA